MEVFGEYAKVYDALYRDKDYAGECDYLERIFGSYASGKVNSLLDIGCGTGGHSLVMASRGYTVTGIDLSDNMLKAARDKAAASGLEIEFANADVRNLGLGATFDAAVSMFAVMSYQTTDADVRAALRSLRRQMRLAYFSEQVRYAKRLLRDGEFRSMVARRDWLSHSVTEGGTVEH